MIRLVVGLVMTARLGNGFSGRMVGGFKMNVVDYDGDNDVSR